jgi:signal transduction histidine kinase
VAGLALALALAVLAALIVSGTLYLRRHLREHLVQRDGDILYTVALARQYANGAGSNLTQRLGHPADQLALTLDISQIKEGVLAARLFDAAGRFVTAFPPNVTATNLAATDLAALRRLQPVGHFLDHARLSEHFFLTTEDASPTPMLVVTIPLHQRGSSNLLAAAQLLLDGHTIAREYARVDQHLWWLALGLFLTGGGLLSAVLTWAYRRLRRAQALLEDRTARLLRANHELALAAKTSALGSVTAHLIHGLGNPLANLRDFIAAHGGNGSPPVDLEAVASATRRMQQLVHDVVRVLGEERGGDRYELSLAELAGVLTTKLRSGAENAGVHLLTELNTEGVVSNHHANLVLLILENLIQNALQATKRGGTARVSFMATDDTVRCEVEDEGPGIPDEVLPRLFTPCRSTRGGSGLGLAISRQLALHLGGELALQRSTPAGCTFVLSLPRGLFSAGRAHSAAATASVES